MKSVSERASRAKPSWYLSATEDKMIPPPAQRQMAARAGATVTELPAAMPSFADIEGRPCACRKSNPNILVVQPAQDRAAKNGPGQFDGARDRRILLQR